MYQYYVNMISNTWQITIMFYMPYKTISYYVCCANMSGSKIFYKTTDSIHYVESEDKEFSSLFKAFKPFKLECMAAILC